MTGTGLRSLGAILTAVVIGFGATLVGCATFGPVTPFAVSDIKEVTGTWKGVVYTTTESDPSYITLVIREDGSYEIVSAQGPIGTSRGRGKIVVSGGRLLIEGARGRGEGRVLRDSEGNLTMEVDGTMSDNSTLSAKLARSN